ncbi:MAG: ACT domain-containing protein [Pseudomonadota bacterium]
MSQLMVISAVGTDRTGVVHDLTQVVLKHEGNIVESRMATLGNEFAMLLMVSGHWHTIGKLESALANFASESGLEISVRPTQIKSDSEAMVPYAVDVVCLDQEGIVYNLAGFFSARQVQIGELNTRSYPAAHTGAPMFSVQATVHVPTSLSIAQLREEYMQFCDHMNIDGILEPIKI